MLDNVVYKMLSEKNAWEGIIPSIFESQINCHFTYLSYKSRIHVYTFILISLIELLSLGLFSNIEN